MKAVVISKNSVIAMNSPSKHSLWLFIIVFFLIGQFALEAQFTIFGDMYVSSGSQIHILFPVTYFEGGTLIAERSDPKGVVSFAAKSTWKKANDTSYVDGYVRIYHDGDFTFPVGEDGIFSPIEVTALVLEKEDDFFQIGFSKEPPFGVLVSSEIEQAPIKNYWSWTPVKGTSKITLNWSSKHGLDAFQSALVDGIDAIQIAGLQSQQKWNLLDSKQNADVESANNWQRGSLKTNYFLNLEEYQGLSFALKKPLYEKGAIISQVVTPNGDQINDTWKIQGLVFSDYSKTTIYDAMGQLVFKKEGIYENDWPAHGTNRNSLAEGSYYYMIDLNNDGNLDYQGWFFLKQD